MTYIRQAEMAQEIAELMAENARLKRELQAAKDAARPRRGDEVSQWMKLWGEERNRVIELQDKLDELRERTKPRGPAPAFFWLGREAEPPREPALDRWNALFPSPEARR